MKCLQKISSLFLALLIIFSNLTYSQTSWNINKDISYKKDSLLTSKKLLEETKTSLLKDISDLKVKSNDITEKIRLAQLEIEQLYIKKFGKEAGIRIYNKQIWKGMTDKMLMASWGTPDKIDKNVEKWGVFTQWYYGNITFFFRDGKLTDWEEKK